MISKQNITLALNMIVGPGEAKELKQCLESVVVPEFFDEIIIVCTSKDKEVEAVAKEYTDNVLYFKWCDDFSKARNYAIENTTSDYIMWLDADDKIDKTSRSRLYRMKEYISDANIDVFLLPYKLDLDASGNFNQVLPRERIFKNAERFRWRYKIHEQISTKNAEVASFKGISIEHHSVKSGMEGLIRNVKILKKAYAKNSNKHYMFYLARDLAILKQYDVAIPLFENFIHTRVGGIGDLYCASLEVARYYTYNEDTSLKTETINKGETYARIAMSFSDLHAEPLVLLGDIYHFKGKIENAIKFYKLAMNKRLNGKTVQEKPFYEQIPSERLSQIYEESNLFDGLEQALFYNKLVLKHVANKTILERRNRILNRLIDTTTKL